MILYISAQTNTLDARLSARFGRAPWFIRFDTENAAWQAVENLGPSQPGGAGVATAQTLVDQGAEAAISGRFGPNAQQALNAAGIKMYLAEDDHWTVAQVIARYQAGQLATAQ